MASQQDRSGKGRKKNFLTGLSIPKKKGGVNQGSRGGGANPSAHGHTRGQHQKEKIPRLDREGQKGGGQKIKRKK